MTTSDEKSRAVILKSIPYKETGALVSVYTRDFGKMTLVAKGVKKMTSKNAASVQPLTLSELTMVPRKGLSTLIRGESINHYMNIKSSIECEIIANYLLEYFNRYEEDNVPDESHFNFLVDVLELLNNGYPYQVIYTLINAWIMRENGVLLDVDGCVYCGNQKVVAFSTQGGGFVCQDHKSDRDEVFPPYVLKAIRHYYKARLSDVDRLTPEGLKQVNALFEHYVEEYCGIHLKSKSFVKQIV